VKHRQVVRMAEAGYLALIGVFSVALGFIIRSTAGGVATLSAPMPGRVIAVRAIEGASVQAHQALVVIEAMKMEHAVVTPLTGTVTHVAVKVGQQVQRGDLLAEVSA